MPRHVTPPRDTFSLLLTLAALAVTAPSAAQEADTRRAQALLDRGRALMEEKRHREACPLLEAAYRESGKLGPQYYLARCYAESGRVATAYETFREVVRVARAAGQNDRAELAEERARELVPRLSGIVLVFQRSQPRLEVHVGKKAIPESARRDPVYLDHGRHRVVVRATGFRTWSTEVSIEREGSINRLSVPSLVPSRPAPAPRVPLERKDDRAAQRIAGYVTGGVGLAAMAAAIGIGVHAKNRYADSDPFCTPEGCTAEGKAIVQEARRIGDIATGVFIGGGVLAAAGLVIVLTALPSDDPAEARLQLRSNGAQVEVLLRF